MTLPDDCENYTFFLVKVDVNLQSVGDNHLVMGSRTIFMWPNQTATVCHDTNKSTITLQLSGTTLKLSGGLVSTLVNTAIKAVVGFKCTDLTA